MWYDTVSQSVLDFTVSPLVWLGNVVIVRVHSGMETGHTLGLGGRSVIVQKWTGMIRRG
jgi:hypothetical protein